MVPETINETADRKCYLASRLAALCRRSPSQLHPLTLGTCPMCDPLYMYPQGRGFQEGDNLKKGLDITEAADIRQFVDCDVK